MNTKPIQLQFYTKPECPLCDEAKSTLERIKHKFAFVVVEEIDITKNLGLFTKYKLMIPVLELNGKQLFAHHIDTKKLEWQLRWYQFRQRFLKN